MRLFRTTGALLLAVLLTFTTLPMLGGCGSGSSSTGPRPVVDIATATGYGYSDNQAWVFVWLNALNGLGAGQSPDIAMEIGDYIGYDERVRYVRMHGEQLFVLATRSGSGYGRILIWNAFRAIVGAPPPDIVLDQSSSLSHPNYMAVFDGDLYVTSRNNHRCYIFRDIATDVNSYDSPDVELGYLGGVPATAATVGGELSEPNAVAVNASAIYVTSVGTNEVFVYHDPATVQSGDAPDVILGNGAPPPLTSEGPQYAFVGSNFTGVKHCFLAGNTLYVTCIERNSGSDNGVWGFSPANALTNYQAPDFILGGPGFDNYPMCVRTGGGKLWVGLRDYETGLMGFSNPPYTGAAPLVELFAEGFFGNNAPATPWTPEQGPAAFIPGHVDEFVSIAGGLIGAGYRDDALFGYLDAASVQTNQVPDYVLWWPGLNDPRTVDAVQR